ncbi:hypothetical protein APSETT445_000998 [Aspergillus pseudonomiae]
MLETQCKTPISKSDRMLNASENPSRPKWPDLWDYYIGILLGGRLILYDKVSTNEIMSELEKLAHHSR